MVIRKASFLSGLSDSWMDAHHQLERDTRSTRWQVIGNFLEDHGELMLLWNGILNFGHFDLETKTFLTWKAKTPIYNVTHFIRITTIEGPKQ